MRNWIVVTAVLGVVACGTQKTGEPSLLVTLNPNRVSDSSPVTVKVSAVAADGKVGTGKVKITSTAGSLKDSVELALDVYGTAKTEFVCDPSVESTCGQAVRVVVEWQVAGQAVLAEAKLNSGGVGGTGGSGGAGGVGGGSGGGNGAGQFLNSQCEASVEQQRKLGMPPTCCVGFPMYPVCPAQILGSNAVVNLRLVRSSDDAIDTATLTTQISSLTDACSANSAGTFTIRGTRGQMLLVTFSVSVIHEDGTWEDFLSTGSPDHFELPGICSRLTPTDLGVGIAVTSVFSGPNIDWIWEPTENQPRHLVFILPR